MEAVYSSDSRIQPTKIVDRYDNLIEKSIFHRGDLFPQRQGGAFGQIIYR